MLDTRPRLTALVAALAMTPSVAFGHVSLDRGSTHASRYGDVEIKRGPCGREGGTRGTNVYTYRPGETILVEAVEYIGHPGYFRIAFDDDGDDDFVDPQTVLPLNRECMNVPEDHCGAEDFFNNETVLLDNLDPHIPVNPLEAVPYSWDVTLPDVTCDNCTLQLIQVMTDVPGIHAPYNPSEPNADDIYYQCIDLVLAGESTSGGDAGSNVDPAEGSPNAEGGENGGEGCSASGRPARMQGISLLYAFAALGVAAARRRRSRFA
jgi:hypothetical protein